MGPLAVGLGSFMAAKWLLSGRRKVSAKQSMEKVSARWCGLSCDSLLNQFHLYCLVLFLALRGGSVSWK